MKYKYYLFAIASVFLTASCSSEQEAYINGVINYTGSSDIFLEQQPIHYKYAPKIHYPVQVNDDGSFKLHVQIDSTEIFYFTINDQSYPLVLQPGSDLNISVSRNHFPDSVGVEGYPEPWNGRYVSYLKEMRPIQREIQALLPDFREGKTNNILKLYKERYQLAKQHLADTPLKIYYYKAIGEYLVKRLEGITHRRNHPNIDPERQRQVILEEARQLDFFSFESLKAQRAGIRDFTNAYANTFGVKERLEEKHGQELMQYDVNRLAYTMLDSTRRSVLPYIQERRALAYAKMHLIAERIGEISPQVAETSYKAFLNEYSDLPEYAEFLQAFYREVDAVSPGNPAVPFTLPDQNGNMVSMEDFLGKYVLLDFWAGWCIPCLDEFPYMRKLYKSYSRDQFEIVAISTEKDSLRWLQTIQRFDNPWPQLYGGNGFQQKTFQAYKGGGIPFYILVGPDGTILRHNDVRPSFNLPNVLDSLINQQSAI